VFERRLCAPAQQERFDLPRYFFNIHDGKDLVDHEGTELRDEAEAKSDAVSLAGRSIADLGDAFWSGGEQWLLEVCDESGTVLFALKFAAVH